MRKYLNIFSCKFNIPVTSYTSVCYIRAQTAKNLPAMQETQVQSLSWEDPVEKGMATHSSILA